MGTARSLRSCSSLPFQTSCGSSEGSRGYSIVFGADSSSATKSLSSSVGILTRLSLWRIASTFLSDLFLSFVLDMNGRLRPRLLDITSNEVLRVPGIGNLEKCPASESTVVVHRWNPQRARCRNLCGLVLFLLAGDFDDQV